jgi:hypothetical protein
MHQEIHQKEGSFDTITMGPPAKTVSKPYLKLSLMGCSTPLDREKKRRTSDLKNET